MSKRFPNAVSSVWNPELVERLKTLWADGLSFRLIAEQIGVTRNAVIGKSHRLKLPPRPTLKRVAPQRNIANRRIKHWFKHKPKTASIIEVAPRPTVITVCDHEPTPRHLTLLKIGPHECHFPFGDARDGGITYCGAPKSSGAYCAYHRSVVYQPVGTRRG